MAASRGRLTNSKTSSTQATGAAAAESREADQLVGLTPSVGTARKFAAVEYPVKGLLCLAEVDYADGWGDSILRDVGKALSQEYLPSVWGFSVAAKTLEDGQMWPVEVSITRKPASPTHGFSHAVLPLYRPGNFAER